MNEPLSYPLGALPGPADWMQDRLTEARGILVDARRYPDSLVILAARVVAGQTDSTSECADAIDLLRQLERRLQRFHAAATFANGGAA